MERNKMYIIKQLLKFGDMGYYRITFSLHLSKYTPKGIVEGLKGYRKKLKTWS